MLLLHKKTLYELLFGVPPHFDELKVFGCLFFAYNQRSKGDKFASHSRKCVFVGYPFAKKGWLLYDLEVNQYFVSRDVTFIEDVFPCLLRIMVLFLPLVPLRTMFPVLIWDEYMEPEPPLQVEQLVSPTSPAFGPPAAQPTTEPCADEQPTDGPQPSPVDPASVMGRGMRSKLPSTRLKYFITCTTMAPSLQVHLSLLPLRQHPHVRHFL